MLFVEMLSGLSDVYGSLANKQSHSNSLWHPKPRRHCTAAEVTKLWLVHDCVTLDRG